VARHTNTFEEYCREKWGWEKAYCNHVIRAAEVVKALPQESATVVASERQARELAKAPEEKRAEVVTVAANKAQAEQRPMTARDIKQAVIDITPEPPAPAGPITQDTALARAMACGAQRDFS
jgi:hypothetical protein